MEEELKDVADEEPANPKESSPPKIPVGTVAPAKIKKPPHFNAKHIIYYIAGALEVLLLFRFVFSMTGANPASGFVGFIYAVTNFFVAPYSSFVFEPGTLVAMVVYPILAFGIAKIVVIAAGRHHNAE